MHNNVDNMVEMCIGGYVGDLVDMQKGETQDWAESMGWCAQVPERLVWPMEENWKKDASRSTYSQMDLGLHFSRPGAQTRPGDYCGCGLVPRSTTL